MSTTETFLLAITIVFALPYLVWRLGRTDYWAPLVVVQTVAGVLMGPGVLGKLFPDFHHLVFTPPAVQLLGGLATWGVMVFVWIAGIELDLRHAWAHRRESLLTAGLALGTPLILGCVAAAVLLATGGHWMGSRALKWQFIVAVGMACAVTALPVLILLMDKLAILRQPLGQRILRYASLDDIAIWGVLALIVMDWQRVAWQFMFLAAFAVATWLYRRLMQRIPDTDRWFVGVVWLAACGFGADACGLHFMVGAFLAGAVTDTQWFDEARLDALRGHVLLLLMPVYFVSTGLRTTWGTGGASVFVAAAALLLVSLAGKLIGVRIAGRLLGWRPGESSIIGWLLQTKGLIMIIFANILLDKQVITNETFTALLLLAVGSTMLTTPMVAPMLARMKGLAARAS